MVTWWHPPGHDDKNEVLYGEAYAYPLSLRVSSHCTWHVLHTNLKIMFFLRMWAKRDEVQIRSSILFVPGCTKSSWKDNLLHFWEMPVILCHSQLPYIFRIGCPAISCSALSIYYTSGHVICTPTTNCLGSCTEGGGGEGYHFYLSFIHSQQ